VPEKRSQQVKSREIYFRLKAKVSESFLVSRWLTDKIQEPKSARLSKTLETQSTRKDFSIR
jgi:hypothetical protein